MYEDIGFWTSKVTRFPARAHIPNSDEPTKMRKVYWHHPGVYALILINLIVYAIVAAIVRKRADTESGLSGVGSSGLGGR